MELVILVGIFIAITFGTRLIAKVDKTRDESKIAAMSKSDFVLAYPRGNIVLLAIVSLIGIGLVLFVAPNDLANWWLTLFSVVPIICSYLVIDYLNWKMTIKNREITLTRLLRQPKIFKIKDIISAEDQRTTLLLRFDDKKKIAIPAVLGIELLKELLQEAGKLGNQQNSLVMSAGATKQNNQFELRSLKTQGIVYLIGAAIAIALLVQMHSTDDMFILIPLILAPFIFVGLSLRPFRWQANIDGKTMTIKNTLGKINTYKFSEITRIDINSSRKHYYLILTIGQKEIARIHSSVRNTNLLLERLQNEKIPMYQNGKLVS